MNVDWFDFCIVETIPFAVSELLSIETPSQGEVNASAECPGLSDDDSDTLGENQNKADRRNNPTSNNTKYDTDDGLNILNAANYVPRVASISDAKFTNEMLDPISGSSVPVEQISNHMRIQLMDQKWNDQQKKFVDKQQDTGYAEGISITDSLKSFARQRGDIFGNGSFNEVSGYDKDIARSFSLDSNKNKGGEIEDVVSVKRKRCLENPPEE
jgi:splicing factor 3A subunit 1